MLRLENITFSYDDETEALKDVTLNIEKGKKTLSGHEGCRFEDKSKQS